MFVTGVLLLQPEFGEPQDAKEYLCPLTADRDKHIGDDLILQVCTLGLTLPILALHFLFQTTNMITSVHWDSLSRRGYYCVIFIFRLLLKITEWDPHKVVLTNF